ncbi:MAG: NAD-glutamate dehydrogenase, partial [Bauldia sp.]
MLDMSKRKRLIHSAAGAFAGEGLDDQRRQALAADLFAYASVEDLAVYSLEEIAGFVSLADAALQRRKPGRQSVNIADPEPGAAAGRHGAVTVITILNDNMPFLFDSVIGELQDFGAELRLVAHPMISVRRKASGELVEYLGSDRVPGDGVLRESLIQIHVARLPAEAREALAGRLDSMLDQVRRAVVDWKPMLDRLDAAIAAYRADPPPVTPDELEEAVAFLEWLREGNFTFLGMREYDFVGGARRGMLERADAPGLGILADPEVRVLRRGGKALHTTAAIREFLMRPDPLIIAKSNTRSRVHRRGYMDYVGVKRYARKGALAGELRIVGLFTSTAYTRSARTIPYLRRKTDRVIAAAGYDPESHSGKALVNVLETFPREELFQIDEGSLLAAATDIVQLGERPRVRVIARRDRFDRFVSVLVYLPRDHHNTGVRVAIGEYLAGAYNGHVSASQVDFPEGPLARTHYIIGRDEGAAPDPERGELERAIAARIETWADGLKRVLAAAGDPAGTDRLLARFRDAFPSSYRDDVTPETAIADIAEIEKLTDERPLSVTLSAGTRRVQSVRLRLIHRGAPIALSVRVPILESMGFRVLDERTYAVEGKDEPASYLHDMALQRPDGAPIDLDRLAPLLVACFTAVWFGQAESDGYNALVLNAGIAWRDIAALRAVSRYLQQAGIAWSQDYLWGTLNRHPAVAVAMVEMFQARFDPALPDRRGEAVCRRRIDKALDQVQSLDEDRIIRWFTAVIGAMLRTNFFQPASDGAAKAEISFKLESRKIDGLPRPRPFREIFVYSPRFEAVHLRFGRIARGGIRWSDRSQDFRTEILGLAKAQQVKNAVIVPVGAKGGFVPKKLAPGMARDAVLAEGTETYRLFMGALLDLTDNLDGKTVVPPAGVVIHEEPDPYLVVAADKGTATFSDIANGIATARGFWLGDAFASGGSAGYDHKAMGITARGAWEAVKRHFREMDRDIQTSPFTVAGIGDMSGDVFGNGMLLSPETRLVAAVDHRDIFIDPDPDPAVSLAERRRLFEMPRSSWQDYDKALISRGGGVFPRAAKAIPLSAPLKALFGLAGETATPQEVVRAILKAKVDLLWFGGIGTFVRASSESDDKAGDRANDAVRITAAEVGARVIGEGANLAMTQRARVEYGLLGGRSNSDAIDNSAGVNTSDVEVNIKIALAEPLRAGRLDMKRRDRLLKAMTGEVGGLVLRNNYLQTLAISLAEVRGLEDFGYQLRLMQQLEARGLLDRALEALPDDAAMAERQKAGKPLTRPEIALLLAYAKLALSDDLVSGGLAEDPALDGELIGYFPKKMGEAWRGDIESHPLRAEIIATVVANAMINRGGPTYLTRIGDVAEAGPAATARAYVTVRDAYGLEAINAAIDALDGRIKGALQLALYRVAEDLLLSRTAWFIRNVSFAGGVGPVLSAFAATVAEVGALLGKVLPAHLAETIAAEAESLERGGVPPALALRLARLPVLADATDIHLIATAARAPVARAAAVFFAVDDHFHISRVEALAGAFTVADYVDGLALDRALETLADAHRRIAGDAIAAGGSEDAPLDAWLADRGEEAARVLA